MERSNDSNNTSNTAETAVEEKEEESSPGDQVMIDMLHEVEADNPEIIESFCAFTRENLKNGDEKVVEFMNLLKNSKSPSSSSYKEAHLKSFTHEERMLLMWFGTFLLLKENREEKERQRQRQKKQSQWPLKKETKVGTCDKCHDTGVTVHKVTLPEAYKSHPEELSNRPEGEENFYICLKCLKKMEKAATDFMEDNPYFRKEIEAGEQPIERAIEGMLSEGYFHRRSD
jgi:hypothetical protein